MNTFTKQISSKKIFEYYLLSIMFIMGLVVRLYKIYNPIADWHSWRQADTASVTKIYVQDGLNLLLPRYHDISSIQTGFFNPHGYRFVEFPVFNLIHYSLTVNFSVFNLEMWGRLTSVFAALVCAISLYYIGKQISGQVVGMLAAFFYLFIPYNIYFTRVILPDPLTACLFSLALAFYLFYDRSEKKKYLWLFAICFALSLLTKPFAIFYGLPVAYLALKKYGTKGIFSNIALLLALDLVLIPFLLWRIWIFDRVVGIAHMKWAFNGDGIRFRPAFWRWIFGERIGKMILGTWGAALLVFGLVSKQKDYFVHFFFLSSLVYLCVFATANVRHDYYQILIIPSICILLALGAAQLFKVSKNKMIAFAVFVFTVFIMFGVGFYEIKDFYRINHPEIVIAGSAANAQLPEDALVIAPYNGDTAFLYQTGRSGWPIVDTGIEEMIDKGAQYYISVNKGDADTQNFQQKYAVVDEADAYIIIDLTRETE